jgi:predicted phosphodiesterase
VRVAALYDVHGNVHALEAALAEVDADVVLFGGDLASGPFPRETVELARSLPNGRFVRGNADVLASPAMSPAHDRARRWVERQLDDEQIEWLATLPFSWSADDTLFVHANPLNVEDALLQGDPDAAFEPYLRDVAERRVVTGHVHIQFRRAIGEIEWIGAGSVGFPAGSDGSACWALVADGDVVLRRTAYDVGRAARAMDRSGHPLGSRMFEGHLSAR